MAFVSIHRISADSESAATLIETIYKDNQPFYKAVEVLSLKPNVRLMEPSA